MKLATKLVSAFVAVSALGALVSVIGIRNMASMNDASETMYSVDLIGLSSMKEANIDLISCITGIGCLKSGDVERMLILTDIEALLSGGLIDAAML